MLRLTSHNSSLSVRGLLRESRRRRASPRPASLLRGLSRVDEVHGREGAELAADRQTHLAAPEHLAHLAGGQWHAGKCSGIRRECMACVQAVLGRVWVAPLVPCMRLGVGLGGRVRVKVGVRLGVEVRVR